MPPAAVLPSPGRSALAGARAYVEVAQSLRRGTEGLDSWTLTDLTLGLYTLAIQHAAENACDTVGKSIVSDRSLVGLRALLPTCQSAFLPPSFFAYLILSFPGSLPIYRFAFLPTRSSADTDFGIWQPGSQLVEIRFISHHFFSSKVVRVG